jgi:hypothetical protein
MRRALFALAIFLIAAASAAGGNIKCFSASNVTDGSYTVYRCILGEKTLMITFVSLGNDEVICLYKTETGTGGYYTFTVLDGSGEPIEYSDNGSNAGEDAHQAVLTFIAELVTFSNRAHHDQLALSGVTSEQDMHYENNAVFYVFKFWVPLFNLYAVTDQLTHRNLLDLVEYGKISGSEELSRFLSYVPFDVLPGSQFAYVIRPAAKTTVDINGTRLTLDANWRYVQGSSSQSASCRLADKPEKDAYLTSFNSRVAGEPRQAVMEQLCNQRPEGLVIPRSVQIECGTSTINAFYEYAETGSGVKRVTNAVYLIASEGIHALVLDIYASLYYANAAYFQRIFADFLAAQ